MRRNNVSLLLTLVLLTLVLFALFSSSSLKAAPKIENRLEATPTPTQPQGDPKVFDEHNLIVTQPKGPKVDPEKKYYFPWRQSMAPRFGLLLDLRNLKDEGVLYSLGITYMFPDIRTPQWEVGADIISNSEGHLHGGLRWIFNDRNAFRPFLKAALMLALPAEERLVSFFNSKNYMLRGSAGFEDLLSSPASLRIEGELAVGLEDLYFMLMFGYSWAWND